jgi:ABC-type nickel/cobalt efflux system permease component RcnA
MRASRLSALLIALLSLGSARLAFAHPMGNFSVNHYSKIEVLGDRIAVHYLIDLAEIPTFQELQQGNITAATNDPAVLRFIAVRGEELGRGLSLTIDNKGLPLRMTSSGVIFPPGAGGLPTMKMGFAYEAVLPPGLDRSRLNIHYADSNYEGHSGWKEIVAVAKAGTLLSTSVPETDRSAELSNYPTDLLNSPPQNLEASLEASLPFSTAAKSSAPALAVNESGQKRARVPAKDTAAAQLHAKSAAKFNRSGPATLSVSQSMHSAVPESPAQPEVKLESNRQQTPRSKFTELIAAQNLSLWFLFTAAIIAVGLGALHALEPGHGKTIVAAYLVGSRGTARHAVLLGLIVTTAHTTGVCALGLVTLYASRYIVPEQLYPWLGALSGITIAVLGCYMFLRRLTGTATDHSHASGASHGHWPFSKRPIDGAAETPMPDGAERKNVSLAQLFTLGITGGIIPCPAALVVLLSAVALHRIGLGLFLIVAFSCGLAAVLIAFGMLMVYAGRFMARFNLDGPLTKRWLPAASAAFITVLGLTLAVQSLVPMHFALGSFSRERVGPFLFVVGLGLVLGMRHSTDPDHVVAISTIVSKQRSMKSAALIGSVWGLGHTITVFAVGALIILFGVEIPPRVGLSMEFSVAIMLVLLGVLNLTGVLQKVMARFSRVLPAHAISTLGAQQTPTDNPKKTFLAKSVAGLGLFQLIRPLAIGLVHGLAGSAAVALLVLSTIHDPAWATVYLLVFGFGTLIGMMVMTTAISVPLAVAGQRSTRLGRYFGVASGMVSLCFGSFLVYQLGFVGGLFGAHPHWTPQ